MKDIVEKYIQDISAKFSHETTSEYGYRTPFEILLKDIFAEMDVRDIGHDDKAKNGNKPDFVIRKNEVPLLYIEVKDFGISLDTVEQSEQMARYFGYDNLILSDYVEFRFYRLGVRYGEPITIAKYDTKTRALAPISDNYEYLAKTLLDFTTSHKEPIRSGGHLAKIMGAKAQRIRDNVRHLFASGSEKNADLVKLYETFRELLIHDLKPDSFADMYAQTLVYGLFVARFYDKTLGSFSRQEARELVPNSNRFLKHFFDHIVGADFKSSLRYIVDELCEVFSHANVAELMDEYFKDGKKKGIQRNHDQVIHFYEDFLNEYDKKLRKEFGAYYTPEPVVNFIVKSTNQLLKNKIGIKDGLSDTTKIRKDIHRVQILDPAVGTGTFINAIIREIYTPFIKNKQEGRWPAYVHNDLLPRIHGFELMMAPYTIAHLRLGIAFRQSGFWDFHKRLGIYLTNSLEDGVKQQDLFAFGLAESIINESKEASVIKNEMPIMVVIGNPPYNGESNNKFYKSNDVYKIEPTGGNLKEKNSKWLNDDYVKFMRFAENMIEKTGEGIIAMITPHGYIDNPTFRGMRWHLMNTFDEIYVLDLHGNAYKKEKAPDDTEDMNVFDIKTGVAIFFGVKKNKRRLEGTTIYKADLFGKRTLKFDFLNKQTIQTVNWIKIKPVGPNYEWTAKDEKVRDEYRKGFSISELFPINVLGYQTHRDNFAISFSYDVLEKRLNRFTDVSITDKELIENYKLNVSSWNLIKCRKEYTLTSEISENISQTLYRPFDIRYVVLHKAICDRPRTEILQNVLNRQNPCLLVSRQQAVEGFRHVFVATLPANDCVMSSTSREANQVFPLYKYSDNGTKTPNLNKEIIDEIKKTTGKVSPEDVFDYIYAVLHSPNYREKYKEFLKLDFPRVPYPKDEANFKKLVKLGHELRELHLLESSNVNKFITTYPVTGSDTIEKRPEFNNGKVYINDTQYFGNVPEVAWNFWIGGYQPAQKWLKDRIDRTLTNEDIEHYQKMIIALTNTDQITKEINKISI